MFWLYLESRNRLNFQPFYNKRRLFVCCGRFGFCPFGRFLSHLDMSQLVHGPGLAAIPGRVAIEAALVPASVLDSHRYPRGCSRPLPQILHLRNRREGSNSCNPEKNGHRCPPIALKVYTNFQQPQKTSLNPTGSGLPFRNRRSPCRTCCLALHPSRKKKQQKAQRFLAKRLGLATAAGGRSSLVSTKI